MTNLRRRLLALERTSPEKPPKVQLDYEKLTLDQRVQLMELHRKAKTDDLSGLTDGKRDELG